MESSTTSLRPARRSGGHQVTIASVPPIVRRQKRAAARVLRAALIRWARGGRRQGPPRVYILIMNAWGMGGTIRTTQNLASHLAEQHEVEILSVVRRRKKPFFPFPEGVQVTTLDDRTPEGRGSPLERLARRLLSSQRSLLLHPSDKASEAMTLWTDVALVRALRRRGNGVLIGTRPALNLFLAEVAPESLVRIGQEHMNLSTHGAVKRRAMLQSYPALDALITLTKRDLETYRESLAEGPVLDSIPNATAGFGSLRSDGSSRTVVAAGRLSRQKAFSRLITAFAHVVEAHPDWNLVIYGSGPRQEHLEEVIAELDLAGSVTLPGPTKDMGKALSEASIYALSSRFEGFPMVLLEAMSVGLPVVAFDCPTGPREIVEDRRNGLLIPDGDVDALAAGLIEMIEDDQLRRRCSEGAAETAARYSVPAIGARWDELIERLTPR
jgi:glycosyltransferase involved in cell wall biosynthesis